MNNYSMFGMAAYLLSFLIAMVVEKKKKKNILLLNTTFLYIFASFWLLKCAVNSIANNLLSHTKCENKAYSFFHDN